MTLLSSVPKSLVWFRLTFFLGPSSILNELSSWSFRPDKIGLNFTNTFLVFTEEDIGDLLKIKLSWEGPTDSFSSMFKKMRSSFWSWSNSKTEVLQVRRIRVKAGETQKK